METLENKMSFQVPVTQHHHLSIHGHFKKKNQKNQPVFLPTPLSLEFLQKPSYLISVANISGYISKR